MYTCDQVNTSLNAFSAKQQCDASSEYLAKDCCNKC